MIVANDNELIEPLTITVGTACRLSGLGPTKLWELVRGGQLKSVYVGRRRLIEYQSLKEMLTPKDASIVEISSAKRQHVAS
jgi:excisionase family DNA binding protein